jgi:hypothetical protein
VNVTPESLCDAVTQQFTRQTGWQLRPDDWQADERRCIEDLAAGKYSRPAWNSKR